MASRRLWIRLGLLAAVAAAFAGARLVWFAPEPLAVRVARVEVGRVEETVTNSRAGTVKARRRARLSPEIGGQVVALPKRRGERVAAGDVLLRLEDSLPRARVALATEERRVAEAQREQTCFAAERAERERERMAALAASGIVSADLLDGVASESLAAAAACRAASAAAARAASALALAEAELGKYVLRAPFDGVLADVAIEEGEWTTPSPPAMPIPAVVDLLDTRSIYVSAPMDEVDSGRLAVGQRARLTVDSRRGETFAGRVVRVAPYVLDLLEQNRTVELELELDEEAVAATLLPGTSADAEVILSTRENVLRVPTSALLEGGRVLVLADGELAERTLQLGLRNWDFTEVAGGLAAGERVVVSLDRPEVVAGARAREAAPEP